MTLMNEYVSIRNVLFVDYHYFISDDDDMSDLVMLQGILGASFTLVRSNQTIQTYVDGMALNIFFINITI